jgi:uncharacterized protein YjeT (DUF2065 family)
MTFKFVLTLIGCVIFFEGIPYFLSPGGLKKMMAQVIQMENGAMRRIGFILMVCGLLTVAVGRYLVG